jgi:tetratricopeptide (TPR) repeat protein
MGLFPILIIGIVVLVGAPILFFLLSRGHRGGAGAAAAPVPTGVAGAVAGGLAGIAAGGASSVGPGAATGAAVAAAATPAPDPRAREAARRLAQNPRDAKALLVLAEAAFRGEDYEGARERYRTLLDLCAAEPDIDEGEVILRHGIAAFKAGAIDEAHKSLLLARTRNDLGFDENYTLGCLEFGRGDHEKAAVYLIRAHRADPDSIGATKLLGESLFALGHFRDSIPLLRRAFEQFPGDAALLFTLGEAYAETDKKDTAARIFGRLRTDPRLGPRAALRSAEIQTDERQYDRAIEDLEIGLRHAAADADTRLELKYRLGVAHLKKGDIAKALVPWKEIADVAPTYRDVPDLLARYREISSNAKLKAYLLSPISEFVTLCRKLAVLVYPRTRTKILSVSLRQSEYVDITAEVDAGAWHDAVLFRFMRASGVIGELALRDMYAKLKEIKAGRGICIAPATFSTSAKAFTEGRVLDVMDKPALIKLLARVQWTQA